MGFSNINLTVDQEAKKLALRLKAFKDKKVTDDAEVKDSFRTLMALAMEKAKQTSPGTERFKSLFRVVEQTDRGAYSFVLKNLMDRSKEGRDVLVWMEFGTRAHEIRPKNARALRWLGASGLPIFSKLVLHPGTKPYLFFTQAAEVIDRALSKFFDKVYQRTKDRIVKG